MAFHSPTRILPPDTDQQLGDIGSMQRVMTVWLEGLLEAVNCLAEPSLETFDQQGLYIDRILVEA
jgi:hypothetical protein